MEIYINKKKRHQINVSPLKTALICGTIFGVIGFAVYLIFFSPVFLVKEISINGNNLISTDELRIAFKDSLMKRGKIFPFLGENNMFFWDCGDKEISAIEDKFPVIEKLEVNRDFTERKVLINVFERNKYGIVCSNELEETKSCFWFDKKGIAFNQAPQAEGGLINKLDVGNRKIELGEKIIDESLMNNLVTIFEILDRGGLRMKSLVLSDPDLKEVETSFGISPEIHFSLRNNLAFALPAIEKLRANGLNRYSFIDFRVENRMFYKIK